MSEEDERFQFISRQVIQAFRNIQIDKINDYLGGDSANRIIFDFLNSSDTPAIFFRENRSTIEVSDVPIKQKGQLLYFVKLVKSQISESKIASEVIVGDIYTDPLEHLAVLSEKIYHPIVASQETGQVWSEAIAKEVRDNFDTFVANVQITQGHVRGVTCLPIPGSEAAKIDADIPLDQDHSYQVHALEGAIITWTKQIKNILKQDPESIFQVHTNPGPLCEIEFWTSKAGNLNGIFDQLQSVRVRRVLKILDKSKSTYNQPFAKLCKEVFHARAEANNIVKYLRPLVAWFEGFENESDFEKLVNHFRPIIHLVLLVWKSSAYYNMPARLVVLMRQICNTLIRHATDYLNGDTIFELLEAGETHQAVKILQNTLRVFGKFKSTYFDYKAKANVECPDNPWRIQNNAIFVRLDGFLERCHDILDLAQTILQFSKLSKIEVGGTKGKTLTTSVAQIHFDFTQAVDNVRSVGKGILDLENKKFEDAFYEFRCRMKELDRRLGSVITQGFDDASTVAGRFRLLDSFDSLILRPIIADELEKKHGVLISAVKEDAEEVQRFFNDWRQNPPVASNLPPIAGALTWCRGLLERIQLPLEKLKSLDKKILEREDARESVKMYAAFLGQLSDFEKEKIEAWGQSIEISSQAKLRNPLLKRQRAENSQVSLLYVNFDPVLVQLLREVKYFLLLGLQVPDTAMDIFQRAEIFRRHTGNLDLIVNMYNDIQTSLLPVERPLVKNQLERIDKTLSQGVGDGKGKTKGGGLNWKSNGIELFIGEAMAESKEATDVLHVLKGNLKRIQQISDSWETQPIFERGPKTALVADFVANQKKFRQGRLQVIKESGQEIHKLLKDTNKKLKVSQGLPDWKSYIDFVNNIVVSGLIRIVACSIKALANQLSPKLMEVHGVAPMLEIQLDLINNEIVSLPPVHAVSLTETKDLNKMGIHNLVKSWINGMLGVASCFKRLDTSEGTYLRELTDSPNILIQKARIGKFLKITEENTDRLRKQFRKFENLWLTDLQETFAAFLKQAVQIQEIEFIEVGQETDDSKETKKQKNTWKNTVINLEMFNERINAYLEIQSDIQEFKSQYDVDFLKINTQPAKQAISTWVTKWLYCHTQYLQNYIADKLIDLHSFLDNVNSGLEKMIESGDREGLMRVMTYIRDVRKRMPEIAVIFDPLRNIVLLLKKHSIPIDLPAIGGQPALDFLEAAKMIWDNTVNKAFRVKEEIQPLQNSMLDGIRKEIRAFEANAAKFLKEFRANGPFNWIADVNQMRDAYIGLDKYQHQLTDLILRSQQLRELEDLFELPLSQHTLLEEIKEDLRNLKTTWDVVFLVHALFLQWKNTLWAEIKTDDLIDEVRRLQGQIKKLPRKSKDWPVAKSLETYVKNMYTVLPLVHELHSPAMRERHWKTLMITTGTVFDKGPTFCLDDLLNLNLHAHVDVVLEIVEVANKELKIEAKLNSIQDIWNGLTLRFDRHRDSEVFVVSPPDDVLDALEEHHLQLQSMSGMGKFVDFFREIVLKWQTTLGNVESTLKLLLMVQRQWGSLESIFLGSQDIRTQLPDDTKRFEGTDAEFKELMREIQMRPDVVTCCTTEGREASLTLMHKELEKCEKALNEYLEVKKGIFPRFYFVSNAALLDILSNGNNPAKIMAHIGSVFDGIGNLDLCLSVRQQELLKNDPTISTGPEEAANAMISKDKEKVDFHVNFEMHGAVEVWLNELVSFMQETLRLILIESVADAAAWELDKPREEWVFAFPAQIGLVTSQIIWTEEVEGALENLEAGQEDALKKYAEVCSARLEGLIRLVQGQLSSSDRIKIITIITIDVHNRDVVSALVSKRVENNVDFKWQSQLRYMWIPEDKAVNIRICDYATVYSFEYVGNCGRLVITPLTDRCYVTLTVALRLCLGGAPAGPAGTGKTETTKDLARGLGLPCYVFNCSDQMNYQTMGDIFKGLTQVGAWGCFDEFNRIEIEVLSVVASQVRTILDAISTLSIPANRMKEFQNLPAGTPPVKVGTFSFFGDTLSLVPTVGLFITMNPGYAGRTELPENLKALFRSCAMIRPDLVPIAENMLMAEGFVRATPLSVKFVTLYKLSSELLSKQHHYDWGLRAVKSVLCVAGILKRANPMLEEEAVMMRALRDFNTPKIPNNDIPIFLRLIADLFPGLDLPADVNEKLAKQCVEVCKSVGLQPEQAFISKVLQFKEILDVRHSVMLLGPGGCGKTSVWKTLAGCHNLGKSKPVTMYDIVNPKSVTTDELYGYMTLTKDWRDGVLSIIMRNMSKNISPYSHNQTGKWVVLDGDIDSVWIESMNTVMDDNKVLTLVSNERIPLSESMRMVFEIHSLKNATPATVSRAGILYINDTDIGYSPFVDSWLRSKTIDTESNKNNSNLSSLPLLDLFDKYLHNLVGIVNKFVTVVPLPLINMVQSLCYILDGILLSTKIEKNKDTVERMFVFAAMWAFGGALTSEKQTDYRKNFSTQFKAIAKDIKFPDNGLVFDYSIDFKTGECIPWSEQITDISNSSSSSIIVPTADTTRLTYLMNLLSTNGHHVMFVGSAGTGKTILVSDYLNTLTTNEDGWTFASINMNFYTDSLALQQQLEQYIDKRSGKSYGPPSGRLIYFIDDLNLPQVETYGTQTPMALMRQHIDHRTWFDRVDMGLKKTIVDSQYICCMNHKSGSFFIDPRLQRHFVTFACHMPGEDDLTTVFGTILNHHFYNFTPKIQAQAKNLIAATISLHKEISLKFLPSAVKFHYNFTMRDLANVIKGLLNSRPKEYVVTTQLSRLWYHEVLRVFGDRLVTDVEVQRCRELSVDIGKRWMEEDAENVYSNPVIYTHFTSTKGDELGTYLPCDSLENLKHSLESQLNLYNESNPIMNLVLFEQAMLHVTRIARILLFPGGNALLVGVGGSGKQSLSKLAAFICGYQTVQISISADFTIADLKENLKDMYRKAGVKPGDPLMFLLTDSQITDERFLVYINDLLSSGRIPDLFTKEEYDGIFASLRNVAKAEGIPDGRDSMMNFFIGRVRSNLHVVLCFSPVGDAFRQRARKFPGIINCTCIDWFQEWPKDALVSVAQRFLEGAQMGDRHDVKDNIAYHMAEVHTSVGVVSREYLKQERRHNYTTPKSFLELIDFYKTLLKSRRSELFSNIKRLDTGLTTLQRTNKDVEVLQLFLIEKKKEVEGKRAATDKLLEEMGQQRSEAQAQQNLADIEKAKADTAANEARALEQQAEGDLAIARPALDAANEAVNCLDKNSLTELKSFSKPPAGVDKVTTALLVMIKDEKKDFSWDNAKKMMAKVDAFKEKLELYRGEDIPEDVIARVQPCLEHPDFTYDRMKTKSAAAANLCNWVINIIGFNAIYKRVKPLMDSLEIATQRKRKAEEDLAVVEEHLAVIEGKLNKLQASFMEATKEKAKVEKEAQDCLDRLSLAERLTTGLASENARWTITVQDLRKSEETLAGDVMLAAAFTSYIGAFGAKFRRELWSDHWLVDLTSRDVPTTPNIDPLWVLTQEAQVAEWQNEGLPADRISIENGAIITTCSRWPLLIDPQLQGIRWLKKHEEIRTEKTGRSVVVMSQGGKKWMSKIIAAIQSGNTVILENVGDTLDSSLEPILTKAVYRKGKSFFIKIGDEDVEYDNNFRLYLQTKYNNPHYKPEISAQCTIINFIVTKRGLEDQLLATIVSEEEPQLEQTRNDLVKAFNNYKVQLKDLEDTLLERLANAPEDILSDIPLIEGLEATKETAIEINEAVKKGQVTEIGINDAREVYRIVATEASLLYFVMLQLCTVDHMYQFSLDSFTKFFLKSLQIAPSASNKQARVENLQTTLRWTIFKWVVRGLFEKHKLIFLVQLTFSLMQQGMLTDCGYSSEGLRYLLLGPRVGFDGSSPLSWMSDTMWAGVKNLSTLEGFERFAGDVEDNGPRFLEWYQHYNPEKEKLPLDWRELDKTPFKKLLAVRTLRPDRMTAALNDFIREIIPKGKEYVECDSQLNSFQVLEQSFEDSSPLITLYFILSPGADVVSDVDKLAAKFGKVKGVDYHNISLGQGQDVIAEEKLDIGHRQGHWVFLDNVHLMPRWLHILEKKLEGYALTGTHSDFRVMLSSDPSTSIPISILERSIKITSDPPSGLKANLKQAFACFSREMYEELEPRSKGILFGLCQFHAVLVERKKFGAKGYNMTYPFSTGDLVCSAAVLKNYMESAPQKVPWDDLRYLFGEIMYGGHIVNDFDRLLATTYLEFYMKEDLLDEMVLYPFLDRDIPDAFRAPATSLTYSKVVDHIDDSLKTETPAAFGLHPNAEIGFRTAMSEDLLRVILELSASDDSGSGDAQNSQMVAEIVLQDILEMYRDVQYDLEAISQSVEEIGPFQNVVLQECERTNILISEMVRSLIELDLGFKGELSMSDTMEDLSNALFLDRVPKSWETLAYPSMRSLALWLTDLQNRIAQTTEWSGSPGETPVVTWISGLFNPQAFLTAVMQAAAQTHGLELDKLTLVTDITKKLAAEEMTAAAKEGTYITGLYLEGASWNVPSGTIESSKPREMFCSLPVINIRPVIVDKFESNVFQCPVYKTQQRGPTYVFSMQLKSKTDPSKWVLAGVVSVMDVL